MLHCRRGQESLAHEDTTLFQQAIEEIKMRIRAIGAIVVSSVFALGFFAGQSMGQQKPPTEGKGITAPDPVLMDLGPEIQGYKLRVRIFNIAGGGIVPLHDHKDNPVIAHYYGGGSLSEFNHDGKYVKERGGSKTFIDDRGINHWYENKTKDPVTVVVSDIVKQ
jgi:quercetin dioxygenase-like cupin family protein